ncbi:gephyrin-like molybdotransferase Glp [Xenophilus sp. Marseille-Q4582]|uniref:molybdopterin molybdotransferase MoeA n=1 Tax=Xenophilus sp. Marseille-Q4582 TaxID=2866600 RepID=UPI001CE490F0|nr:gephyrin-like molybdotransferase Glp [Xenophilus sp. Marseille-Q4582]
MTPSPSALAASDPSSALPAGDWHVDEVLARLRALAAPEVLREARIQPLAACLGRVLAQPVVSPLDVPPHDNSAMDGYAFDGAALQTPAAAGGWQWRIVGTALAGQPCTTPLAAGQALRIMTGAVMPPGADTVVPQELCTREGDTLRLQASVGLRAGANRRRRGEDLSAGQCALPAGTRLGPAALGLLASLGLTAVPVLRPLRVALFSTGDELLEPGEPWREGAIYDSNRFTLAGLLARLGCETTDLGRLADRPEALESALRRAALEADVILTSGGVSQGDADHLRTVLQRLGEIDFWRVAMRPGRPLAVGRLPKGASAQRGRALLFGLPGNPVAAMVSFLVFVRPTLLQLMGCRAQDCAPPPLVRARTLQPIRKRPGRTEYPRGWLQARPGTLPEVQVSADQGSGLLSGMQAANALVVLPHDQGQVQAGAEVDVLLIDALV